MKRALITGITGQDGAYLAELLSQIARAQGLGMRFEEADATLAEARERGYVETLFGRRRRFPDIGARAFEHPLDRLQLPEKVRAAEFDLLPGPAGACRIGVDGHVGQFPRKQLLESRLCRKRCRKS